MSDQGRSVDNAKPAFSLSPVGFARWAYGTAPLLLFCTMMFWAGNGVVGKWIAFDGDLPPVAAAFWRWNLALLLVLPLA
ncbi:MAG: hypothetical protein KI792_00745 [Alphaproteobacteria bacterium]|nr:hypothetical protein [Alphaproteobacteria bacterium SS10]